MAEEKVDLFNQPMRPVTQEDKNARRLSFNDYRRQRDRLISDQFYNGKEIPGQPVYED